SSFLKPQASSLKPLSLAGVVLCGGRSSRMGRPKAWLPFGPERMLQRVVRILSEAAAPVCVVAAPGQDLPELPDEVLIARDQNEGRGPLLGMAAGLRRLSDLHTVDAAYISSCDVPFLSASFIRHMAERLGPAEIVVPRTEGFFHPLAAIYRIGVLEIIERM